MKPLMLEDPTAVVMTASVMVPAPALSLDSARASQGCPIRVVSC
jgi:hypothetical protein